MRVGTRGAIAAACAAAALAVPAAASAKVVTYGGTVGSEAQTGGDPGLIALDVRVDKKGTAKKVVGIRAAHVVTQCDESGQQRFNTAITKDTIVNANGDTFGVVVKKNGKFRFSATDPATGLTKAISGKFTGRKDKKVAGNLVHEAHFQAEGELPEEDCRSGVQPYSATKGGRDVAPPSSAPRAIRR